MVADDRSCPLPNNSPAAPAAFSRRSAWPRSSGRSDHASIDDEWRMVEPLRECFCRDRSAREAYRRAAGKLPAWSFPDKPRVESCHNHAFRVSERSRTAVKVADGRIRRGLAAWAGCGKHGGEHGPKMKRIVSVVKAETAGPASSTSVSSAPKLSNGRLSPVSRLSVSNARPPAYGTRRVSLPVATLAPGAELRTPRRHQTRAVCIRANWHFAFSGRHVPTLPPVCLPRTF